MNNISVDPSTIFLIWYIIPGYIAFATFFFSIKMAEATMRVEWSKIRPLTKIIISVVISTVIYAVHFKTADKGLLDIAQITGEDLLPLMGIGLVGAIAVVFFLVMLVVAIDNILSPLLEFFVVLPLDILAERRRKNKTTPFEQYFNRSITNIGFIQDMLLVLIKDAFENDRVVEIKLKSGEGPIIGKIEVLHNNLHEFGIKAGSKLIHIKVEDIALFTAHEKDRKRVVKDEFRKLKNAINTTIFGLILFTIGVTKTSTSATAVFFLGTVFLIAIRFAIITRWQERINEILQQAKA